MAITPFNVTDFVTNRKTGSWKALSLLLKRKYDFLLVINTNLPSILRRFQVIADYWSNFRYR